MSNWYPAALVHAGPAWKQRPGRNPGKGVVCHSAEGSWYGLQHEIGRADRGAAWHFSVLKDGLVYQHYPIDAVLWHAGDWGGDSDGANGNGELVGIEHEGKAGEPLTDAQRGASVALVKWIAAQRGWRPSRTTDKTLWEHRELSDTGTLCPSNRIPWGHYTVAAAPTRKPPPAPTALRQPHKVASFWTQAYQNGAQPIRYEDGFAVYEIRVKE